jgi:branched-subunit amino acid transport protein
MASPLRSGLGVLLAAVASWGQRVLFITVVPTARLPTSVRDALDDVAPAVMAALVVSSLAHGRGPSGLVVAEIAAAACRAPARPRWT